VCSPSDDGVDCGTRLTKIVEERLTFPALRDRSGLPTLIASLPSTRLCYSFVVLAASAMFIQGGGGGAGGGGERGNKVGGGQRG